MARDMVAEAEVSKEELTRAKWLNALRQQGGRQCLGAHQGSNKVCAMVLLGEEIYGRNFWMTYPFLNVEAAGAAAGLTSNQTDCVIAMNDGLSTRVHTFAEIADEVEGWFKEAGL